MNDLYINSSNVSTHQSCTIYCRAERSWSGRRVQGSIQGSIVATLARVERPQNIPGARLDRHSTARIKTCRPLSERLASLLFSCTSHHWIVVHIESARCSKQRTSHTTARKTVRYPYHTAVCSYLWSVGFPRHYAPIIDCLTDDRHESRRLYRPLRAVDNATPTHVGKPEYGIRL